MDILDENENNHVIKREKGECEVKGGRNCHEKVDPTPSSLATSMVPSIMVMSCCEMTRPRPVPPYALASDESA